MNKRDPLGLKVFHEDPVAPGAKPVSLAVDPDEIELCTGCGCKLSRYRGRDDFLCKPCKLLYECPDCKGHGRKLTGGGVRRCPACDGEGVCL